MLVKELLSCPRCHASRNKKWPLRKETHSPSAPKHGREGTPLILLIEEVGQKQAKIAHPVAEVHFSGMHFTEKQQEPPNPFDSLWIPWPASGLNRNSYVLIPFHSCQKKYIWVTQKLICADSVSYLQKRRRRRRRRRRSNQTHIWRRHQIPCETIQPASQPASQPPTQGVVLPSCEAGSPPVPLQPFGSAGGPGHGTPKCRHLALSKPGAPHISL